MNENEESLIELISQMLDKQMEAIRGALFSIERPIKVYEQLNENLCRFNNMLLEFKGHISLTRAKYNAEMASILEHNKTIADLSAQVDELDQKLRELGEVHLKISIVEKKKRKAKSD